MTWFDILARRALEHDPELAFVTAWGDAPAARGLRPCTEAMLLGRPFVPAPTLFRDEGAGEPTDRALRLLAAGGRGAVLDVPFPEVAPADPRALLQAHRATVERCAEDILVVREGWRRFLRARNRARHQAEEALRRELRALDEEAAVLERCIARLR
jgi:hypothetical protein